MCRPTACINPEASGLLAQMFESPMLWALAENDQMFCVSNNLAGSFPLLLPQEGGVMVSKNCTI